MNTQCRAGRLFFRLSLLLFVVGSGTALVGAPYSKIVVFGDSLSDNGNVYAATGGAFPPPPYVNGRSSNGPVWVEYLAGIWGIPSKLLDYAYAGATSGRSNYDTYQYGIPGLPGVLDEIDQYLAVAKGRADPNALYIIQAGANDIFLWAGSGATETPEALVTGIVTNLAQAVLTLHSLGARNIMVVDLPDLGSTPDGSTSSLAGLLTTLSFGINTALGQTLDTLANSAHIRTLRFSFFATLHAIQANPAAEGFADATHSYLSVFVGSPDSFLFWDAVHPTTAGHLVVARAALISLGQGLHGAAGGP